MKNIFIFGMLSIMMGTVANAQWRNHTIKGDFGDPDNVLTYIDATKARCDFNYGETSLIFQNREGDFSIVVKGNCVFGDNTTTTFTVEMPDGSLNKHVLRFTECNSRSCIFYQVRESNWETVHALVEDLKAGIRVKVDMNPSNQFAENTYAVFPLNGSTAALTRGGF